MVIAEVDTLLKYLQTRDKPLQIKLIEVEYEMIQQEQNLFLINS